MCNGMLVKYRMLVYIIWSDSPEWSAVFDVFILDTSLLVQCYDEVVKHQIIGLVAQFGGHSHKRVFCSYVRAEAIDV